MTRWRLIKDESHGFLVVDEMNADEITTYEQALKNEGTAAFAKWDGCIHLILGGDYVHICDVDDLIIRLIEIRDHARKRGFEGYGE